ncbi:MAG: HD domain-containing protein [Bacteroidota bacterium]
MSNLPLPSHLLEQLSQTEQNPRFHAEGSVLAHTEMVLEKFHELKGEFSLSESEQKVLYWASIVHDLGKIPNTVNVAGRWKAPGHERAGVPLARNILLAQPDISTAERHQILDLVRWHGVPLLGRSDCRGRGPPRPS